MEISIFTTGDVAQIKVAGCIDEVGAKQLKEAFNGLSLDGRKAVSFDFGQVSHIGSAGLGKLLLFYQKLASRGLSMRIENTSGAIRDLLLELRLDSLFQLS